MNKCVSNISEYINKIENNPNNSSSQLNYKDIVLSGYA